MIHSSHRDRKAKAIAVVLAMIADAHPELAPHHPRPVRETDEWIWESATEFCAALDRYAEHSARMVQGRVSGSGKAQFGDPAASIPVEKLTSHNDE